MDWRILHTENSDTFRGSPWEDERDGWKPSQMIKAKSQNNVSLQEATT